jgi:hypothetical protein
MKLSTIIEKIALALFAFLFSSAFGYMLFVHASSVLIGLILFVVSLVFFVVGVVTVIDIIKLMLPKRKI